MFWRVIKCDQSGEIFIQFPSEILKILGDKVTVFVTEVNLKQGVISSPHIDGQYLFSLCVNFFFFFTIKEN